MDSRQYFSRYRLECAQQCIKSAKMLFENGDHKGAANRSYYAIFHSIRAVLALDGVDFKKHSGVTSYFRKNYIKTGKLPTELSDFLSEAFLVRQQSDYADFFVISKQEVERQIQNAQRFYEEIERFLSI